MRFGEFICVEAIRPDLQADGQYPAIQELVQALADAGEVYERDRDRLVDAIETRERLGTTALGHDAAIPHAKHPAARRCVGTVGISRRGLDFHGIDRERVHIVFLVVSPPDRATEHIEALGHIAGHLRDELFCRYLKESRTALQIQQLLEEADNRSLAR
jgi:PTS system fructose-specific IIA component/PTS system nitrogen regulatory IIA component